MVLIQECKKSKNELYTCIVEHINLAVPDAMSSCKEVRDVMKLIQDLIAFIRGSPKRLAWFAHFQNDDTGIEKYPCAHFAPLDGPCN